MTHLGYLIAGWGIVALVVGLYAFSLVQRGKRLAARVPVEKQRWMSSKEADRIGDS